MNFHLVFALVENPRRRAEHGRDVLTSVPQQHVFDQRLLAYIQQPIWSLRVQMQSESSGVRLAAQYLRLPQIQLAVETARRQLRRFAQLDRLTRIYTHFRH